MSREELPLISVGMPVKDRRWCIERVVDSIYNIDYPKNRIRLIFVDSSTDGTYEFLKKWASEHGKEYDSVIIEKVPPEGIPKARNACLKHFKGDFFLSMDSDVIAKPDSVRKLLEYFKDPRVGISGIQYWIGGKDWLFGFAWLKWMRSKEAQSLGMGFTMMRRELIEKLGRFDEKLIHGAEDGEFCYRAVKAGYKIVLDDSYILEHLHPEYKPLTLMEQFKYHLKRTSIETRAYIFLKDRPFIMVRRIIFYSTLIASIPLIVITPIPFLVLLVAVFIYHGLLMGRGWGRIINPFLITSLGIVWTIGVLAGLLKALLKRKSSRFPS